ncbi:MAG: MurT ligase domain-containing protein [Clostridium sp.]
MEIIKLKSIISILVAKATSLLSKTLFKGGTNFPGKVALKIDRNILKSVTKGYKVILVTGTNGKTTTTSMISNILISSGKTVISNSTGANLYTGIIACFINNFSFFEKKNDVYAVIEVDEANLKFITNVIDPQIITVTNLFRDQLDRYGEVYTTLTKILEGINLTKNAKLILNGDESLLGDLKLNNEIIYYGFDKPVDENTTLDINADSKFCKNCKAPYGYEFITFNHLGKFFCTGCDYKRDSLKYGIKDIIDLTPDSSTVKINTSEVTISQAGVYNIYNALCAYSICAELGIEEKFIIESLSSQSSSFGRQETLLIGAKKCKIFLVKNPAGYNQSLDTISLNSHDFSTAFLLNDNYADGTDVSWIWDVNFEKISTLPIKDVLISGSRLYDMAIRLKTAGLDTDSFKLHEEYSNLTEEIKNCSTDTVYILATYTAMINFRKFLHSKGYIENLW